MPVHGLYLLPTLLKRLFCKLDFNFWQFPLCGPSVINLMLNFCVYSNYSDILVVGDHDSDLTMFTGNRNKWFRDYQYFFTETPIKIESDTHYNDYLRKFLRECYDQSFLPERFSRIQYVSSRHYRMNFPNFQKFDLIKEV